LRFRGSLRKQGFYKDVNDLETWARPRGSPTCRCGLPGQRASVVQELAGTPVCSLESRGDMAGAKDRQEMFVKGGLDRLGMQLFPGVLPQVPAGWIQPVTLLVLGRLPARAAGDSSVRSPRGWAQNRRTPVKWYRSLGREVPRQCLLPNHECVPRRQVWRRTLCGRPRGCPPSASLSPASRSAGRTSLPAGNAGL
jgi:hypothetical protein